MKIALPVLSLILLAAPGARGQEPIATSQQVMVGCLPCNQGPNPRTRGVRQLVWELMKRTSVDGQMETVAVDPARPELFETPFLLWSCQGPAADLNDAQLANLRRFLSLGGFLFVDDPAAAPDGEFAESIGRALLALFPDRPLKALPADHVLFRTFFLVDRLAGRILSRPLAGIELGDRLAVVYSHNDLLGALSRDLYGNWELGCEPGGDAQREMSLRMGINIIFYALCLDYKNDRVHLPFILRRRKL